MKCLVLLALLAVAAAESFYPLGYNNLHAPFIGGRTHFLPGYSPYVGGHFGLRTPGMVGTHPFINHGRIFKREAESKTFYPGFPYHPFGTPYHTGFPGYYPHTSMVNPMVNPVVSPMVRPYMHHPVATYATHPFMYNPLLKVEEKKAEEHTLEKRESESESESFYPGFHPFMHPGVTPYHHFGAQYPYGTPTLPSMVPRVLPYNFPYYNTFNPMMRTYTPVIQTEKVTEE